MWPVSPGMDRDATPVAQKELIGVFSDWTEVVPGPDQKSVLEGVRELHTKLKTKVFGAFGSDFSMRYRPCGQLGESNQDLARMTYGQLPSSPVMLVFEPSSQGKANNFLQQLHYDNYESHSVFDEFRKEVGTMTTMMREVRCELNETRNELKETRDKLNETTDKLNETRDELNKTMDKLNETRDRLNETTEQLKGAKETIEGQEKRIGSLEKDLSGAKKTIKRQEKRIGHLDKELSSTKKTMEHQEKMITSLKEEHKKDHQFHAFLHLRALLDQSRRKIALEFGVEKWNAFVRENGNQCPAMIYSRFANSLTLECIEFLCDDQSVVRLRGNVIAHHEETDKMQQAIADDDLVEDDRKHLLMLFDFITRDIDS